MNITDVDDKIIKRTVERLEAAGQPVDPVDTTALTREMEALFWADMRALNVCARHRGGPRGDLRGERDPFPWWGD